VTTSLSRLSLRVLVLLAATALGCGGVGETHAPDAGADPDAGGGGAGGGPDAGPAPDAGPPDAGPTGPYSDDLSVIVEPSDSAAALVAAITAAKTSVHMTMYLLTSKSVINALIDRQNAGVEVEVVLNKSFPAGGGDNATVFSQLAAAKVAVHWAPAKFTYTHEKCVIIDGATAWIMTMNAATTSPTANREYLGVDTEAVDVAEAEAIFAGDFAGTPPVSVTGKLLVSPINMRPRLLALVNGATTSIDLGGEELSDYQLLGAIVARHAKGVAVRVVIAKRTLSSAQQAAVVQLKGAGITVISTSTPYIHGKTIVVDGATSQGLAYIGSANFTSVSLDDNRELGLVTSKASEIAKISAAFATDHASGTAL
jgi:phosphatidylserine/phosphatidylglycerophosphate/cardiolipin synthase-like enzyme